MQWKFVKNITQKELCPSNSWYSAMPRKYEFWFHWLIGGTKWEGQFLAINLGIYILEKWVTKVQCVTSIRGETIQYQIWRQV